VEWKIGDEQQGFSKAGGTTGGMFALIQVVEKKLERQEDMAIKFMTWRKLKVSYRDKWRR